MRNVCKDTAVPSVSQPESMQGVTAKSNSPRCGERADLRLALAQADGDEPCIRSKSSQKV